MLRSIWSISSLLIGMGTLVVGSGLLGILIGLRGVSEGFSNFMLGLIMSGYYSGYIAGSWVCPILIKRVGHVRCFASFAALSAVVTLSFGLFVDPWVWLVLRVFNGLALMGIYMVIESWLNERSQQNPGTQGSIFAVYMMVSLVAVAAGQYLITIHGASALESFAIAAILFCLGLLPIALTPVPQPLPVNAPSLSMKTLAKRTPSGVAGAFCSGLVLGAFWALTPIYGRALDFTDIQIANFTAAAIFGGALMQWPIGWLSDHRDRREVLIAVALGTTVTMYALSMLDRWLGGDATPNDYIALSFLMGSFVFSIYAMAVAQTADRFPAHEALEATRGLLLLHGVGAALGPIISSMAMQRLGPDGFPRSIAVMTAVLVFFVWYRMRHDPPVPQEDRSPFHLATDQVSPVAMEMDPRADAPLATSAPDDVTPPTEEESASDISPEEAAAAAAAAVALALSAAASSEDEAHAPASDATDSHQQDTDAPAATATTASTDTASVPSGQPDTASPKPTPEHPA
ncbi:MAG: MFS transporter [Lautropia sp.]|nr:MFS transporter [Lautropia sp.]